MPLAGTVVDGYHGCVGNKIAHRVLFFVDRFFLILICLGSALLIAAIIFVAPTTRHDGDTKAAVFRLVK